ncbi:aldo/keto reductase, partial [Clostridium estertheticum]|nr:aldo/keto reductase [Clostridium estertheticum]
IILRWHIQEGNVIFPKTTNPEHLKANIDIFDFALTEVEMNKIKKLDKGVRYFVMSIADQEAQLGAWKPED